MPESLTVLSPGSPASSNSTVLKGPTDWQSIIARQSQSGLTIKAFCQQHELTVSTFYAWRKRLNRGSSLRRSTRKGRSFVRLEVSPPTSSEAELVFPNGVMIRLFSIDLNQLVKLMLPGGSSC